MHCAARHGRSASLEMLLRDKRIDVDAADQRGRTSLADAADAGRAETTKALVKAGADAGLVDAIGRAPLHWAAGRGHDAVVALLLDARRETARDADRIGRTPAELARAGGFVDAAALVENAADALEAAEVAEAAKDFLAAEKERLKNAPATKNAPAKPAAPAKQAPTPTRPAKEKTKKSASRPLRKKG